MAKKEVIEKPIPDYISATKELELILYKPLEVQEQEMFNICKKYNCVYVRLNAIRKQKLKTPIPKEEIILDDTNSVSADVIAKETAAIERRNTAKNIDLNNLLKAGILKWVENNPTYVLDIKCRVLAMLDKARRDPLEFDNATELLVMEIKKIFNIYTIRSDDKDEVLVYDEGIYIPEGKSYIKEYCRKILGGNYRESITKAVIDKIILDTLIDKEKLYGITYLDEIPVQNGILNIFTLELSPFTPKKIFFNKLPVKFDIKATCPKIEEFLKGILSKEDDIKVFYELAGFSFLKEYKFEKAFMMVGDGRNGKGKCIELLKRMVGVGNCSALTMTMLSPLNPDISQLFGKFLNVAGDIGNQDLKDTSMFKSLTGRDLISGRRKYKINIDFQNYAKFIFSCNELPMVYDMTRGFWDRWILLEFPYTFVPEEEYNKTADKTLIKVRDEGIIEKISTPEEMSGLLNQALLGLGRLMINKGFSFTLGTEEVKSKWIKKSNSFMAFCYDLLEEDSDGIITKKELRKKYIDYCKKHKITPRSDVVIKKVLQDNYGVTEDRREILSIYEHIWVGLKWKK